MKLIYVTEVHFNMHYTEHDVLSIYRPFTGGNRENRFQYRLRAVTSEIQYSVAECVFKLDKILSYYLMSIQPTYIQQGYSKELSLCRQFRIICFCAMHIPIKLYFNLLREVYSINKLIQMTA